jgi:predicted nucleic acid-binding protein
MPNSAYIDARVFVEMLQKLQKDRLDACQDLVAKAKKKDLSIVTSTWTITEVDKLDDLEKATGISREEQSRMILDFFENPFVDLRQLDRATGEYARELTRTHLLTNADAIHIATALLNKVDVFYTYDDGGGRQRKGLLRHNLKIGAPTLRIERPPAPTDYPLYDKLPTDPPPDEEADGSTHS